MTREWYPYPETKPREIDTFKLFNCLLLDGRIRSLFWLGKKDTQWGYVKAWAEMPDSIYWHHYPENKPTSYTKDYLLTIERHYSKHIVTMVKIDTWVDSKQGGEWEVFSNKPDVVVTAWSQLPDPYDPEGKHE